MCLVSACGYGLVPTLNLMAKMSPPLALPKYLYIVSFLISIFSLFDAAAAQSCWKNLTCTGPTSASFSGVWDANIYAPDSRSVSPEAILLWPDLASVPLDSDNSSTSLTTLIGNGSLITWDFEHEVGGLVTIEYTANGTGQIGLAFSEAKNWVGEWSDSSNGKFVGPDGALYAVIDVGEDGIGSYTMSDKSLRGGFRYLTTFLVSNSTTATAVDITDVTVDLDFQPTWSNLRAYQGYFHCSDDLLNRIYYAGAYTLQSNAVPTNTGRWVPMLSSGWANNGTLGPGDTIIVDGAKRDRAVWPGDMGIAVPSSFYSVGDLESVKNALTVMYLYQNADGSFPEAGPPLLQQGSDTYHCWTLIGNANLLLFGGDVDFIEEHWSNYTRAIEYIYAKVQVNGTGLLNATGTRDWARWSTGGMNTEANMILYRTLTSAVEVATWINQSAAAELYASRAVSLKAAINALLWDEGYGAFKDNITNTTLHPQDANSMAILFNVTDPKSRDASISTNLLKNWSPIGPISPELPNNISPFITSFELQAHFSIEETARALDLLRTTWGWIVENENSTQSTLLEGYLANGSFGYRSDRGYDYDASYVSHSHGWSSGPSSALVVSLSNFSLSILIDRGDCGWYGVTVSKQKANPNLRTTLSVSPPQHPKARHGR